MHSHRNLANHIEENPVPDPSTGTVHKLIHYNLSHQRQEAKLLSNHHLYHNYVYLDLCYLSCPSIVATSRDETLLTISMLSIDYSRRLGHTEITQQTA